MSVKYKYAVAMFPTVFNEEDVERKSAIHAPQAIFDTPEEAFDHAIRYQWWPFLMERIRYIPPAPTADDLLPVKTGEESNAQE